MSIGNSAGGGDILRVDTEMLSQLGSQLEVSASALPDAPAPFSVPGGDAISQAIAAKLPGLETPIIEGLPAVKEAAGQTASNIVTAADMYQTKDEQLAAEYEKHRFDGSGSGGSGGGAGSGGASGAAGSAAGAGGDPMSQMSQMMGTPMQMASQAAQMPMQAMGAVSSAPQSAMQGVQQISQMAGGKGESGAPGSASGDAPAGPPREEPRSEERSAEEQQAAACEERRERVPESAVGQSDSVVPDQRPAGPRHAAPDPAIDV
ncbi:hypothetical protein [Mycolicibacterium sp. YH-1]|uniref:hypothetical protein n=1 Tax=Mycolicibacterium sp. YH-1 TaxID=2908837 RepID=UPI001F4C4AD9|nr:hypothetical protein [Mycolicibacterium sp. YH-1]UNB52761.1 hypothetical protein L0M16_33860 [Mycolicibacterium sp. YH-1]